MEPNPDAIAWYVEEAQRLLEDQQRRAESLKTRGGQVSGFGAAVLALVGGNATAILAADEITNYASDRFLSESDLWRVHLRSLQTLEQATRKAQEDGNAAAVAIMISLCAFLAGLGFSLISLGTLIVELI